MSLNCMHNSDGLKMVLIFLLTQKYVTWLRMYHPKSAQSSITTASPPLESFFDSADVVGM